MVVSWRRSRPPVGCPEWCTRPHPDGESERVHASGALRVRRTILRLVVAADEKARFHDGPFVLVGDQEYTLHEAEVLIGALTQLVAQGRPATAPAVPRMRPPGP